MLKKSCKFVYKASLFLFVLSGSVVPAISFSDDSRIWASQCFQCHGTNGNPVGDMDEIGGKDSNSLYEELIEMKYRDKTEGIMDLHARGYSDEQLRAIAEYISAQGETEVEGNTESEDDDSEDQG
ncbi:MAG: c-type cytochrome [bacterium]